MNNIHQDITRRNQQNIIDNQRRFHQQQQQQQQHMKNMENFRNQENQRIKKMNDDFQERERIRQTNQRNQFLNNQHHNINNQGFSNYNSGTNNITIDISPEISNTFENLTFNSKTATRNICCTVGLNLLIPIIGCVCVIAELIGIIIFIILVSISIQNLWMIVFIVFLIIALVWTIIISVFLWGISTGFFSILSCLLSIGTKKDDEKEDFDYEQFENEENVTSFKNFENEENIEINE
jgi:hypothetical protein